MANPFTQFFANLAHWFGSPRGQSILKQIEQAALDAEPIVTTIGSMVPNRTFQEIVAAYEHYAVPFLKTETQLSDPGEQAVALRDLATSVLRAKHQDVAANVLNAAVELAVAHASTK